MKKLITLIAFMFVCYQFTFSQVIPIEQPQKANNQTIPKKKQTTNLAKTVIKILPDEDCTIYIDGESKGLALAGKVLRIPLVKGSYQLKAVGSNNTDEFVQIISVKAVGEEALFVINLKKSATNLTENKKPENTGDIPMVYVQGGSFNMGSNDTQDYGAQPVHRVIISSFYIGKYEVTQGEWRAIMGDNPSNFKGCDDCPVEQVSWDDVQGFIARLNQKTGKHYRLPTEAEWEYSAKGGNKSNGYIYSGSNDLSGVGWYFDNSGGKTHPKGQKQANELGIYDMSGNVWEWCQDWFDKDYYTSSPTENPQGPATGSDRVIRGGGWGYAAQDCRVAGRDSSTPGYRFSGIGFRLVLVP